MKGRKLLSAVIAGTMVLGTMSFPAFAASETGVEYNGTTYTTFEEARNAVDSDAPEITYTIHGKVVLPEGYITNITGAATNAETVNFKAADGDDTAELVLEGAGANIIGLDMTGAVKNVSYENLILSRTNGGWIGDIGHANNYFTTAMRSAADDGFVHYTSCTFPNGSCNNFYSKTIYTDCKFNNDTEYGLWIYGGETEVTGATFTGAKGVQAYSEDVNADVTTKIKDSTFDGITKKPAIISGTKGTVTLENITTTDCKYGLLQTKPKDGNASLPCASVTIDGEEPVYIAKVGSSLYTNQSFAEKEAGEKGTTVAPVVAKVNGQFYSTLADAVAATQDGDTIILLSDTAGNGIKIPSGSNVTIDFNGFTYNIDDRAVGSAGTETNGFQLLKGSNITFKNGTITSTSNDVQILIQNYSNLTLENMTLDGSELRGWSPYTLSNNCGNTVIKGNTNIIAKDGGYAFDCYYWPNGGYSEGVTVTLGEDFTGKIDGAIEMTDDGTDTANAASKQSISISGGTFTTDVSAYCIGNFSPKLVNGVYVVDNTAGVITVNFKQRDDDKNSYDIVLKGDGEGIYEFVSAELQFVNESKTLANTDMNYEITGTDAVNVIANTANTDRYGFYLKDSAASSRLSGDEVTIGKLTFPAQGNRHFEVRAGESTVITTLKGTHLETTYTETGVSKLEAGAPIDSEVTAATRDVAINVDFAHELDGTYWTDNKITVTLKDAFGNIVGDNAYPLAIANNAGTYTFEDVPVGRITVTLKAPGFRTFTYTTTVEEGTEPLVLSFWNDTKRDTEKAVEIGGRTMENNFVVGDIAMDYIVDKYDLAAVTSYYGTYDLTDESKIKYDLNRDGKIDITDVAYVLHNFGF